MQAAIITIFLAMCISAPWIARRWGAKGSWACFIVSIGFLVSVNLILDDV